MLSLLLGILIGLYLAALRSEVKGDSPADNVLPGMGTLSRYLVTKAAKVIADLDNKE